MTEVQAKFEAWYKQQYWDFPDDIRKSEGGYRHLDVQLAYRAFCAGMAEVETLKVQHKAELALRDQNCQMYLDNIRSEVTRLTDLFESKDYVMKEMRRRLLTAEEPEDIF